MEHRRREAMRSVKLSWFTAERGRSLSNKYVPSEVGIYACISSRITTVIHVVNTTKETIADLMSHSQFHSITLILRHAWLNLWDKHMTTGRINQVSDFVQKGWFVLLVVKNDEKSKPDPPTNDLPAKSV